MRNYALLSVLIVLLSGCVTAQPINGDGKMTSVCDLVAKPASFSRERVRVRAQIVSDGIHRTGLVDQACPGQGVAFFVPDSSSNNPGIQKVMQALYARLPFGVGLKKKRITATVTGTFVWDRGGMPVRKLVVESVSNVTVTTK